MKFDISIFIYVLLLFVAACVPYPHAESEVPNFTGCVIDQFGEPVPGLLVRVSRRGHDEQWEMMTREDGSFTFPGKTRFSMFKYVGPGDTAIMIQFSVFDGKSIIYESVLDLAYLNRMKSRNEKNIKIECFEVNILQ